MKITKRQLRRIIREAASVGNFSLPAAPTKKTSSASGVLADVMSEVDHPRDDPDGIAAYYKSKETERRVAYEKFSQALEKYESLPPDSPEKYKMEIEVDRLKEAWFDAGYVGD